MNKTKVTISIDADVLNKAKVDSKQIGLSLSAFITLLIAKNKEAKK